MVSNVENNGPESTLYAQRAAADSCSHMLPYIKYNSHILDVGCGPGSITLDLAKLAPEGTVIGIDINEGFLEAARTAAKTQGITNVSFRRGNATDLSDLADSSFDIVHAHQVLIHLSNPVQALREMRRLTRPGGFVSTRDMSHQIIFPLLPAIDRNLDAVRRMYEAKGMDRFLGRKTHELAHAAGFQWERIEKSTQGAELARDAKKFADAVKGRFSRDLLETRFASVEECQEFEQGWEEWGRREEGRVMGMSGSLVCWK